MFFCESKPFYKRGNCRVSNSISLYSRKKGSFSNCCKGQRLIVASSNLTSQMCVIKAAPVFLYYAIVKSFIDRHELSTVIDSGRSLNLLLTKPPENLKVKVAP